MGRFLLDYNYEVRKIGSKYIMLPIGQTRKNYIIKLNDVAANFFIILKEKKEIDRSIELFANTYNLSLDEVKLKIEDILVNFETMEVL